MRMVELLQKHQLVLYHLLVALDVLLQDDLYGHLAGRAVCFPNDTIGSRTLEHDVSAIGRRFQRTSRGNYQSAAHLVCSPRSAIVREQGSNLEGHVLLVVGRRLAMEPIQNCGD